MLPIYKVLWEDLRLATPILGKATSRS
jgi:hypothetical protein